MSYKLMSATQFECPLKGVPQLSEGKLYFPYIDYPKSSNTKSYFGIMEYDLVNGCSNYYQAPFYIQDQYITVNYTRFVMHPCLGDDFLISLAWQSNYDFKYRLFKISKSQWFDIDVKQDSRHIIRINRNTPVVAVKPVSKLSLKKCHLDGGALHCWQEEDKICFTADSTHAFERDSSDFTEKNTRPENTIGDASVKKSNMNYLRLSDYLGNHDLPEGIPANHSILMTEKLPDYWVLENDEYLFFLNNDFRKRGYTEILFYNKD